MGVYPCPGSGVPGQLLGNTGWFLRFLRVQLGAGPAEFIPGFLGPGFCLFGLLGLLCFRAAICFSLTGRRFPFTAEPFRGPGPLLILPEFFLYRLRANLARGGFFLCLACAGFRFPLVLKPQAGGKPRPLWLRAGWSLFLSGGLRANLARSVRFLFDWSICKLCDKTDLLSLKMKCASQYLWTLNWHTSLLKQGCGIGM